MASAIEKQEQFDSEKTLKKDWKSDGLLNKDIVHENNIVDIYLLFKWRNYFSAIRSILSGARRF